MADIVLIDGGKGQLSSVTEVFEELGIIDRVTLVAIAKGPDAMPAEKNFYEWPRVIPIAR